MKTLSNITDNLKGQPMFQFLAQAKKMEDRGIKIIHYEIGDPNFNSFSTIREKCKEAIDNNLTHYTNSDGLPEFKKAIQKYIKNYYGFEPLMDQIVVCTANAIIDFVCRCVVNPGEEIIYPDPGFPTYLSSILYNGFIPSSIKMEMSTNFRMDPNLIKKALTDQTRLIIINSSHNPTGSILSYDDIRSIYEISEENDLYLLSDEVYSRIIYDKEFYSPSIYDKCLKRTIILHSLSKLYSMSGWRLGFVIGPVELMKKVSLLLQTIISCIPPFIQCAGVEALVGQPIDIDSRIKKLKMRRNHLVRGLNLIKGIDCDVPNGSFYVFPNITATGMDSVTYAEKLLQKTGVCVLPGDYFGQYGKGYIRLSYASVDHDEIEESIEKIMQFHKSIPNESI